MASFTNRDPQHLTVEIDPQPGQLPAASAGIGSEAYEQQILLSQEPSVSAAGAMLLPGRPGFLDPLRRDIEKPMDIGERLIVTGQGTVW